MDSSAGLLYTQLKRVLGFRKPAIVIDPALDPSYKNRMRLHDQVLPFVSRVVVFGKVQHEFLRNRYGGRVKAVFVPHRIDCAFFDRTRCSAAPGQQAPYVLSVGADTGRDFNTLAEAAAGLSIRTVIHTRRTVTTPLPPNVELQRDWISFPSLRDLYAGAEAVVVPLRDTLHASGINGLLEAMAMGCAVIVSASKGIADYVEHGKTAWVVPPGDPSALREGIRTVLQDGNLRAALGANARRFCEQVCSMPVYARTIASLLRQAIAESK
jgi:glycosyltransferase involved in cell wall biosynthesis